MEGSRDMGFHSVDSASEDFFLVHVERDGQLCCHKVGMINDVNGIFSEREYVRLSGEIEDVCTVWHLGFGTPVLVDISFRRHTSIGFVEVIMKWSQREQGTTRIIDRCESTYYKIVEV